MARTLLLDLESAPNTSYTWGIYDQDVVAIKQPWFLLCIGYQWQDENKVHVVGLDDFPDYEKDKTNDFHLVKFIHELFSQADALCAHNAKQFDVPKAKARMLIHGLPPPPPVPIIDSLAIARKELAMPSNKLDDLCDILGLGRKLPTGGFQLWLDVMAGNPAAWKKMKRYCGSDVRLLAKLIDRIGPWSSTWPNFAVIDDKPDSCPRCGAAGTLIVRGYRYSQVSKRIRYQCKQCLGYCAGRTIEKTDVQHVT